jgi:hypothetical protein
VRDDLESLVVTWFMAFGHPDLAKMAFGAGMFFANEALLVETANAGSLDTSRSIYVSQGTTLTKPSVPLVGKIVVSVFIGLEVLALLGLLGYIYHVPTFCSRLDALTIAAVGVQLTRQGVTFPGLGAKREKAFFNKLEGVDGLIGTQAAEEVIEMALFASAVAEAEARDDGLSSKTVSVELPRPQGRGPPAPRYGLALGAQGLVSRGVGKKYRAEQGGNV